MVQRNRRTMTPIPAHDPSTADPPGPGDSGYGPVETSVPQDGHIPSLAAERAAMVSYPLPD